MPWSNERRMQHRQAMKRTAESNKCPECDRKSAIVWDSFMHVYYCWWSNEGKCANDLASAVDRREESRRKHNLGGW